MADVAQIRPLINDQTRLADHRVVHRAPGRRFIDEDAREAGLSR
ncbi:hypothetical protein [Caulobacter sp.]